MKHSKVRNSQTNRALADTGNFAFIRVAENSKSGAWSADDSKNKWAFAKNQSSHPFAEYEHNQGIVPKNKGLILDVDVDKQATPEEQIASRNASLATLRELFGSETIDAATINSTAGGGLHLYLQLSHSPTESLTAGSLSRLDSRLHGELRVAGANAYVVAEGSVVDGNYYRTIQGNGTLPTLSEAATERLFATYTKDAGKALSTKTADGQNISLAAEFEAGEHKRKQSVAGKDLALLEAFMGTARTNALASIETTKCASTPKYYFRQIGALYEAMSHCYSMSAIASIAVKMGIAKSSDGGFPKTARDLTPGELRQQLNWNKKKKGRSPAGKCWKCSHRLSDASHKASGTADGHSPAETPVDASTTVMELSERILRMRDESLTQNTLSRHYVVTDQVALSVALLAAAPKWARKQSTAKAKSVANTADTEGEAKKMKRAHRSHKKVYSATRYAFWIMVAWFDAHRQKGRRNIWGQVAGIQDAVKQQFGVMLSRKQVKDGVSYLVVAGVLELVRHQAFHLDTGGVSSVYRVKRAAKKFKDGSLKGKPVPKFVDATATGHLLAGLYKGQDKNAPVRFRELSLDMLSGEVSAGRIDESGIYSEGDVVHEWLDAPVRYAEWLWSYGELLGTESEQALAADLKEHIGPIDGSELASYWKDSVKTFFATHPITAVEDVAETTDTGPESASVRLADASAGIHAVGDLIASESVSGIAETETADNQDTADSEDDVEMSIDTTVSGADTAAEHFADTEAVDAYRNLSFPEQPALSLTQRLIDAAAYSLTDDADLVDAGTGELIAHNIQDETFTDHAADLMLTLIETTETIENTTAIANGLTAAYRKVKSSVGLSPKESELVVRVGFRYGVDVEDEFFEQQDYLKFLLPVLADLKNQLGELREQEESLLSMLKVSQERRWKQILKNEQVLTSPATSPA